MHVHGPLAAASIRGLKFAKENGRRSGPLDLLIGVSLGDGPAARVLDPGGGRSLSDVVTAAADTFGAGHGYLFMQAQQAAISFAASIGQPPDTPHLLVALLDQGTPDVLRALSMAGLGRETVRAAVLTAIGVPADLAPIPLPPLVPAGTMDRPALPVPELDERAWRVLRWRQDHLPLHKVGRRSDCAALEHLEQHAAWRLSTRLSLDDDQRYSLYRRHLDEVRRRVLAVNPAVAAAPPPPPQAARRAVKRLMWRGRFHGYLAFLGGWRIWFGNRRVAARDWWFWLRTRSAYAGAPRT